MDLSHKKPGTVTHHEAWVTAALRRVVQGLDEVLDLQALAAPACMAPLHLHRVFRGLVGETPLQLDRRLRLERAACMPMDTGTPFIHRGALTMDVAIETCPARRVAALAHQGPYHTIGAAFARLGGIVGPAGLCSHPDARMVAIYQDDPETVPAAQLRSAAGIIVPPGVDIPAPLHEVMLPAGRWARTLHRGGYQGLGEAWERFLGQWLPQSGHRMAAGDCFELYANDMADTREEDLQTLLYVPLQD